MGNVERMAVRFNGERLSMVLQQRGWSQAEFTRLVSAKEDCRRVSPTLVKAWLTAERIPTLPYLCAIAELTDLGLEDMIVRGEAARKR